MSWAVFAASALVAYLSGCVALYCAPLAARLRRGPPRAPEPREDAPLIHIVSCCRDGAPCLPGLRQTFADQDYPPGRVRFTIVADNCRDETVPLARSLGFDVYERNDRSTAGKGNALTEFCRRRLRNEAFDILVVVDVDGRVERSFLRGVAAHFREHPLMISCATYAKNPASSPFAEMGDSIQAILRLHQEGRAALGLNAVVYGSHGYALSRDALEKIDWTTCTGLVGEDMECRMRCALAGIPVRYAADLRMYNDVTADFRSSLEQRRRWNAIYFPLIRAYLPRLLRRGDLDSAFGVLLLPGPGNLFVYLLAAAAGLVAASVVSRRFRVPAAVAASLVGAEVAYLGVALNRSGVRLSRRQARRYAAYAALKAMALLQSPFFMRARDWAPAPHEADR